MSGHPDEERTGLFHIHTDHLGSVAVLTRYNDGYVDWDSHAYYAPFGTYRVAPTTDMTDRRFTGQRENMEWGLYYYNARYYVPGLGRFASADTIVPDPGDPQSFNRYSYTLNNPIKYRDPSGHIVCAGSVERCDPAGYFFKSRLSYWNPLSYPATTTIDGKRVNPPNSSDVTGWLTDEMVSAASSQTVMDMQEFWQGDITDKAGVLAAWTSLVRTGAAWDFKTDIRDAGVTFGEDLITLGSHKLNFQAAANIFFGFIGREIGMGERLLQFGAGIAQAEHGVDHWLDNLQDYPAGFGDQEFDAWSIGFGFYLHELFDNDLSQLTDEAFTQALDDYMTDNPVPPPP